MRMKLLFIFSIICCGIVQKATAQNVAIGHSNPTPDPKAMLDVQATDKGILIPRVQLADNNTPVNGTKPVGLMVWNNNASFQKGKGFYFWNGSQWQGLIYYAGEGIEINAANEISGKTVTVNEKGMVPAPTSQNKNAIYVTDADGNPKWKTEDKTMQYVNKF